MSNIIKFLLVSFILPNLFLTQTANAILGDINTEANSACVSLKYNLSPGKRDAQTNGEVTKLQTFLHDNGYLASDPTGYFGSQTRNAVKAFQKDSLSEVIASDIDSTIITSSSDRQELASSNFVLNQSGNVYMYTRAKIAYVSCDGNNPDGPTDPITCTQEAKICPDGSTVGRVAPSCDFAICPSVTTYYCSGTAPTGNNYSSRGATTSNRSWSYATSGECTWSCKSGYHQSENTCVQDSVSTGVYSYPSSCPTACGQATSTQTQTCSGGNGTCSGSPASRTCPATASCVVSESPLVITTPTILPTITTGVPVSGIRFSFTGGDGSIPFWSNCAENFIGGNNYVDINPYGYLIGTMGYKSTLTEQSICAEVKVGSQIAKKSFVLPIIQDETPPITNNTTQANSASGNMNVPKLSLFKVTIPSLSSYVNRWAYLRSNSSFVVPKDIQLRFDMNTNCLISREAKYYVFNIDGVDQTKNGQKVKYDLKDINQSHNNNFCESNGRPNIFNDSITITPAELGLSEGEHKIIVRGCTAGDVCSPISDGVPICNLNDRCITTNELDEPCLMYGSPCSYSPLVTISAFVLKVGPSLPKAYTTKESLDSTDFSLVQDETIMTPPGKGLIITGLDMSRSPKLCREFPDSTSCATGQGDYTPAVAGTYPGVITTGIGKADYEMQDPFGRYDWYVRYGNDTPIKMGGYTTTYDSRASEYKWQCVSDYGIVKGSFLNGEGRIDDTTTGSVTAVTPACNASQRGGNDGWPYFIIFTDTNNNKVSCTCNKIIHDPNGLQFATQSSTQNTFAQTLIPNQTKIASTLGQTQDSRSVVLGASTVCIDITNNLRRGAEESYVTSLQTFLISKGLLSDVPTGFYGDKTVQAVKDYQAMKGLPQTGMVYDFTRAAIKAESCR